MEFVFERLEGVAILRAHLVGISGTHRPPPAVVEVHDPGPAGDDVVRLPVVLVPHGYDFSRSHPILVQGKAQAVGGAEDTRRLHRGVPLHLEPSRRLDLRQCAHEHGVLLYFPRPLEETGD